MAVQERDGMRKRKTCGYCGGEIEGVPIVVPGGVYDGTGDDEYYCSEECNIEAMRDV